MRLADLFALIVPADRQVGFRAYDGSTAGPRDAEVLLDVRTPRAVQYLAAAPNQLGIARAFVAGDLEIVGDAYQALRRLYPMPLDHLSTKDKATIVRALAPYALARPKPPALESRPKGRRHSKQRDAEAISHHYDVSNRFYRWVLGPSMAYTCAVFTSPDDTLEQAQEEKFDLVCRKLGLEPGMRLLDVGCGWGGMVLHAVKHYGVTAIGVTLSQQQAAWGQQAIDEAGLRDRAQIRHSDYRDVPESQFDAVSSIGLTEHIGKDNYPAYFSFLHSKLRPGGRLLNHTITRPNNRWRAYDSRSFIGRYVFPDGELAGPGHIYGVMNDSGFEVRHDENLREHYAMTLAHWSRNLEEHWDEAVEEAGLSLARTWRLYLAASRLGFDIDLIQLHQTLGVRLTADQRSGMPLRPDWAWAAAGQTELDLRTRVPVEATSG